MNTRDFYLKNLQQRKVINRVSNVPNSPDDRRFENGQTNWHLGFQPEAANYVATLHRCATSSQACIINQKSIISMNGQNTRDLFPMILWSQLWWNFLRKESKFFFFMIMILWEKCILIYLGLKFRIIIYKTLTIRK